MGWIIFVFVLLVVLSSMRSKAKKTRTRSMQQMAVLQAGARPAVTTPPPGSQPYPPTPVAPMGWGIQTAQELQAAQTLQTLQTAQSDQQRQGGRPAPTPPSAQAQFGQSMKLLRSILSGTLPPGTAPVFQPGNSSTYRPGNAPVYAPGNPGTYRPGDAATYAPGDSATYASGDSPTYAPGNAPVYGGAPTYAPGDSPTYAPVGAVGSRPVITPPAQQAPPPRQPEPSPDYDGSFQPAYATLTELQTARRDQRVIDRDQRRAARTSPEQAPYQGSTAVTSTSLNTTLATPYQPSSLMSSLSSSLSSSLTDSPPHAASTSVFGAIAMVSLPNEVAERVRFHLRNGHEVEAVRLVCDTMNVGLLEATKTVRSYA